MLKYEPTRRSGSRSFSPQKSQTTKPKFHITKDDDYDRKSRSSRRSQSKTRRSRSRSRDPSREKDREKSTHFEERRKDRRHDSRSPDHDRRRYKVPSNLVEDTIKTSSGLILHIARDDSPPPRRISSSRGGGTYERGYHSSHHSSSNHHSSTHGSSHHGSSRTSYSSDDVVNEFKLYIENITPEATAKELYELLSPSARQGRLQIDLLPLRPGHQARIAFARFSSRTDADDCLTRNHQTQFLGNEILISWKKDKM